MAVSKAQNRSIVTHLHMLWRHRLFCMHDLCTVCRCICSVNMSDILLTMLYVGSCLRENLFFRWTCLKRVFRKYCVAVRLNSCSSEVMSYDVTFDKRLPAYTFNKCLSFHNKCTNNVHVCCDWHTIYMLNFIFAKQYTHQKKSCKHFNKKHVILLCEFVWLFC